ncbi:AAA family ATPase, partial [Escherichia coli]|nr:AAA family ATPase [Escherichia coli]
MPLITRLMLQNFKKFPELDLRFSNDRNILVGDNESGKSTILLALDLVLSDSRHRVEALGVESLLSQSAVRHFQEGERRADQLPVLNRPGFPGECFICELRLPDHRFRWKHNKLFLLLPEEY